MCDCIDEYLDRSKSWRNGEFQLLLSSIRPHKAVSTSTVSRWITDILKLSGVDTSVFSGHSTRSASSSKAKSCGVPVKEILKRGHWSSESTFTKYYYKDINKGDGDNIFQHSILS